MLHNRKPRLDIQVRFFRKFLKILLLIPKIICFLQTEFISTDFEFRSLRTNLWRPKLPRLSIMFHTCSLLKLFSETDSCISPTSLSSDWFCLKTSFQRFWFRSFLGNRTNWSFPGIHRVLIFLEFPYFPTKFETLRLRSMWQPTHFVCYKKSF